MTTEKTLAKELITALINDWCVSGKATTFSSDSNDFPFVRVTPDKAFPFIKELQTIVDTTDVLFDDTLCTLFLDGGMKISVVIW